MTQRTTHPGSLDSAATSITDEFRVMTLHGPHFAYSAKATLAEAGADIEFDGRPGLFIGCRTRTVITSDWQPVEWPEEYDLR